MILKVIPRIVSANVWMVDSKPEAKLFNYNDFPKESITQDKSGGVIY